MKTCRCPDRPKSSREVILDLAADVLREIKKPQLAMLLNTTNVPQLDGRADLYFSSMDDDREIEGFGHQTLPANEQRAVYIRVQ